MCIRALFHTPQLEEREKNLERLAKQTEAARDSAHNRAEALQKELAEIKLELAKQSEEREKAVLKATVVNTSLVCTFCPNFDNFGDETQRLCATQSRLEMESATKKAEDLQKALETEQASVKVRFGIIPPTC